jgi:hypothetical protein
MQRSALNIVQLIDAASDVITSLSDEITLNIQKVSNMIE